jgi:hypothetical protein
MILSALIGRDARDEARARVLRDGDGLVAEQGLYTDYTSTTTANRNIQKLFEF